MRRRPLRKLDAEQILEIYFNCENKHDILERYGYQYQHFYKRMRQLGLDLIGSRNQFTAYDQKTQREIIFSALLEAGGDKRKAATILCCSYVALQSFIQRFKLSEPLKRALELEDEERNI